MQLHFGTRHNLSRYRRLPKLKIQVDMLFQACNEDTSRRVDIRLPGKGNSNSHGATPVYLNITMVKWIRTSRLSIKKSLSSDTWRGRARGRRRLTMEPLSESRLTSMSRGSQPSHPGRHLVAPGEAEPEGGGMDGAAADVGGESEEWEAEHVVPDRARGQQRQHDRDLSSRATITRASQPHEPGKYESSLTT